jgi:hypothetical protein
VFRLGPVGVGHRHIVAVQRDRNHAIEADQVDELGGALFAEMLDRLLIGEFGQLAGGEQRGGDVIGGGLLGREVARALAGDDGRDLVVGEAAQFGDQDMRVDFVGRAEFRAGDQDRDLPWRMSS